MGDSLSYMTFFWLKYITAVPIIVSAGQSQVSNIAFSRIVSACTGP